MTKQRYTLMPTTSAAIRRWEGEITDEMRTLMGYVTDAEASGLTYNSDLYPVVMARYEWTPEELVLTPSADAKGVPALFSMEIYLARKRLREEQSAREEADAHGRLHLKVGDTLGSLRFTHDYKRKLFRGLTVLETEPAVKLRGRLGSVECVLTISACAIERAQREMATP